MRSSASPGLSDENAVFDDFAEHFDRTRRRPWPECVEFLRALSKKSIVLDIGCGNGRHMLPALKLGHTVIGLDRSLRLLWIANQKMTGQFPLASKCCSFIHGDAILLPLRSCAIDAALYIATIHHFRTPNERLESLAELGRVLHTEGTALISAWALEQERFEHLRDTAAHDIEVPWKRDDGVVFQRYYHLFDGQEFEAMLTQSSLHIERVWFASDNWYGLVRKR